MAAGEGQPEDQSGAELREGRATRLQIVVPCLVGPLRPPQWVGSAAAQCAPQRRPPGVEAQVPAPGGRLPRDHGLGQERVDGYATLLGERGATLSGGQRQRLALARALLADAPVLVLDEATSSVDERREADIVRELASAASGRTVLVVAHRLAAVRHADRIVVLDSGRVDAVGEHAALVEAGGVYTRLVEAGRAHRGELAA